MLPSLHRVAPRADCQNPPNEPRLVSPERASALAAERVRKCNQEKAVVPSACAGLSICERSHTTAENARSRDVPIALPRIFRGWRACKRRTTAAWHPDRALRNRGFRRTLAE